jgi:hypothetical protein
LKPLGPVCQGALECRQGAQGICQELGRGDASGCCRVLEGVADDLGKFELDYGHEGMAQRARLLDVGPGYLAEPECVGTRTCWGRIAEHALCIGNPPEWVAMYNVYKPKGAFLLGENRIFGVPVVEHP